MKENLTAFIIFKTVFFISLKACFSKGATNVSFICTKIKKLSQRYQKSFSRHILTFQRKIKTNNVLPLDLELLNLAKIELLQKK